VRFYTLSCAPVARSAVQHSLQNFGTSLVMSPKESRGHRLQGTRNRVIKARSLIDQAAGLRDKGVSTFFSRNRRQGGVQKSGLSTGSSVTTGIIRRNPKLSSKENLLHFRLTNGDQPPWQVLMRALTFAGQWGFDYVLLEKEMTGVLH